MPSNLCHGLLSTGTHRAKSFQSHWKKNHGSDRASCIYSFIHSGFVVLCVCLRQDVKPDISTPSSYENLVDAVGGGVPTTKAAPPEPNDANADQPPPIPPGLILVSSRLVCKKICLIA